MHDADDLLPISALQHWAFCPRQCALIHLDRLWAEDVRTASGRQLHKRTHDRGAEWRRGVRVVRSLPLASRRLGLAGQADVVEFRPADDQTPPQQTTRIPGLEGTWSVSPVEYKRGRPKTNDCDRIQLCAQALCLEEMLGVAIPNGQIYYGLQRNRTDVALDAPLRRRVRELVATVRAMLARPDLPPPQHSRKCRACSLNLLCLPARSQTGQNQATSYLRRMIARALGEDPPGEPL